MSRLAIIIIVILGLLLAAALTCVGAGWYFVAHVAKPPENVAYTVVTPEAVAVGETFTIDVVVSNNDTKPRTLVAVDLYRPLIEGVSVLDASPPWKSESDDGMFMLSLSYEIVLQPGETRTIVLNCEGTRAGTWEGDIDVCIDSQFAILSSDVSLLVSQREQGSP
jgi:hypothetical protein